MYCISVDVLVSVYMLPSQCHLRFYLQRIRVGFMCTVFMVVIPFVPRLNTNDDIQTLECRNEECLLNCVRHSNMELHISWIALQLSVRFIKMSVNMRTLFRWYSVVHVPVRE